MRGPVVRGFDPPATPFGRGHLGVDFATAPGTPVRAAGAGVVVFSGRIGDGLHVVVRHPGDIRTTDSFLATIAVVAGQTVSRGAVVGTSGGRGPGHATGVLHFGVRVGERYVDPMLLFAPPDLAAVVHLASPRHGASANDDATGADYPTERAAIAAAVRVDGRPRSVPPAWWRDEPATRSTRAAVAAGAARESTGTGGSTRPGGSPGPTAPMGAAVAAGLAIVGAVAAGRRQLHRRLRRAR